MNINQYIKRVSIKVSLFLLLKIKAMGKRSYPFNSVLIIDNEDTDLFIAGKMFALKKAAKEIHAEKSTDAAIALIKKLHTPPDLVLIDFISNDYELIKFLREYHNLPKDRTNNCKIVIQSALLDYYDNEVEDALCYDNVVMAMPKPMDEDSMQIIIDLKKEDIQSKS